jgi:hypothetical protein
MNPLVRYKPAKNSNFPCADLMTLAERELSAFFNAINQLFGSEQAELSAGDWLQELIEIDGLPVSTREWRLLTVKVLTRLASRVSASSRSTEPQIALEERNMRVFVTGLQASLERQSSREDSRATHPRRRGLQSGW